MAGMLENTDQKVLKSMIYILKKGLNVGENVIKHRWIIEDSTLLRFQSILA